LTFYSKLSFVWKGYKDVDLFKYLSLEDKDLRLLKEQNVSLLSKNIEPIEGQHFVIFYCVNLKLLGKWSSYLKKEEFFTIF